MPVGQDTNGKPYYAYVLLPVPPVATDSSTVHSAPPAAVPSMGGAPVGLPVKLFYPINDLANQTRVLTGEATCACPKTNGAGWLVPTARAAPPLCWPGR